MKRHSSTVSAIFFTYKAACPVVPRSEYRSSSQPPGQPASRACWPRWCACLALRAHLSIAVYPAQTPIYLDRYPVDGERLPPVSREKRIRGSTQGNERSPTWRMMATEQPIFQPTLFHKRIDVAGAVSGQASPHALRGRRRPTL